VYGGFSASMQPGVDMGGTVNMQAPQNEPPRMVQNESMGSEYIDENWKDNII